VAPKPESLAQEVASEAPRYAPPIVDMAATSYPWYGNDTLDDCPQAAVAEDIQTLYGVEPSTRTVLGVYHQTGNSLASLFGYLQVKGMVGYRLVQAFPVPVTQAAIEEQLRERHPLFAVTLLPGEKEAHAWLVVGFSKNGPIMASWARLLRLGWPRFLAETSAIWQLSWLANLRGQA
jgi:Papain-like cysteine protease AvrRpt2